MLIVHSRNSVPIRLTKERWQHIVRRHPEMEHQRAAILGEGFASVNLLKYRKIFLYYKKTFRDIFQKTSSNWLKTNRNLIEVNIS